MIITALARYQNEESLPFGYAHKPLGFTLVLWPDGRGCTLLPHYDDKGKAPERPVPNLARTVRPAPFLGCDNATYTLGLNKPKDDPIKTARKHELFVGLVREYHAEHPDPRAEAYLQWITAGRPGLDATIGSLNGAARKRLDLDPVAIAAEHLSDSLHDVPAAREFWATRARAGKSSGITGLCLVCGTLGETVPTLPQSLIGHQVPGATQANVALASVNFPAASRGASGLGLRSAPICGDCAARAVQNFNTLAGSRAHSWRDSGGQSGFVWWTTDSRADDLVRSLLEPDDEQIAQLIRGLLEAPFSAGSQVWEPEDADRFYGLFFSGNIARFVVRRWIQLPLSNMRAHITAWFQDVESANRDRPHFPLRRYAACLGALRREQGKWVAASPDGAVEALVTAALTGSTLPPHHLQLALSRASAEIRLTESDDGLTAGLARRRMEARLGLLRLILNRTILKENLMAPHLDESREDSAYLSGRIFAVRLAMQRAAMPNINASILDKYFERALSNPVSVEGTLAKLSQQHLAALRRKGKGGTAYRLDELCRELSDKRHDAPGRLTPAQQAAWLCGFDQQRQHDIETARAKKAERDARTTRGDTPEDHIDTEND